MILNPTYTIDNVITTVTVVRDVKDYGCLTESSSLTFDLIMHPSDVTVLHSMFGEYASKSGSDRVRAVKLFRGLTNKSLNQCVHFVDDAIKQHRQDS